MKFLERSDLSTILYEMFTRETGCFFSRDEVRKALLYELNFKSSGLMDIFPWKRRLRREFPMGATRMKICLERCL